MFRAAMPSSGLGISTERRSGGVIASTIAGFLVIAAISYLAVRATLASRFPSIPQPTIWFAVGILAAVLISTPPRTWWIYGTGATGGILLALNYPGLWKYIFIAVGIRVAYCCLLAYTVRRIWMGGPRFDRAKCTLFYVSLATVAPAASHFVSMGLVKWAGWRGSYWLGWQSMFLSDVVALMTVTPALLAVLNGGVERFRRVKRRRYVETAALALILAGCGWIALHEATTKPMLLLTIAPLSLLIWAAVRFGPSGTALLLLAIACLSIPLDIATQTGLARDVVARNELSLQLYLIAMSVPLLFLAALLAERKATEGALRVSEERYREVVESQSELICRYKSDTTLTFVNEAYCKFFGRGREQLIGMRFTELIPLEGRQEALNHASLLALRKEPLEIEHEVLLPDGSIGWHQWKDFAICDPDGCVVELQGIGRDITERKRSEESMRKQEAQLRESHQHIQDLAGKLIAAQEAERTRIARELHDGVNQQLAALSINLSVIKRKLPESDVELQKSLTGLQTEAMRLADDLRNLSHELHPGLLRHAGLIPALKTYCEEFHRSSGIEVMFEEEGGAQSFLPRPASPDLSLCIYRVAQEALRNIARHACARRVRVALGRDHEHLKLSVTDDGRGFDLNAARAKGGLGLLSMDERVRLAQGTLRIESNPRSGTRLHVLVPLGVQDHDHHKTETVAG